MDHPALQLRLLGSLVESAVSYMMAQTACIGGAGRDKLQRKAKELHVLGKLKFERNSVFEGGSIITMNNKVELEAKIEGSVCAAAFRSCCAGEGVSFTHYHLTSGARSDILLARQFALHALDTHARTGLCRCYV